MEKTLTGRMKTPGDELQYTQPRFTQATPWTCRSIGPVFSANRRTGILSICTRTFMGILNTESCS